MVTTTQYVNQVVSLTNTVAADSHYDFSVSFSGRTITRYFQKSVSKKIKKESKKERILRVSKEKMKASWKTFNQRAEKIIQVKQICKPMHRINLAKR